MSAKRVKFIRVLIEDIVHLYELGTIKSNTLDIDQRPSCPCCHEPLVCIVDITQYGFIEDKFTCLFTCSPCGKAWWYSYTLSMIEVLEVKHD